MKYILYAGVIVAAILLLIYAGVLGGIAPWSSGDRQAEQDQWETRTDDTAPVTIAVTPIELGAGADNWKFNVTFATHSGSLDEDPAKVAVLMDDKGGIYRPTAWAGPGPGGHHRTGVLAFKAISPTPSSVELKIKNVGGVPERSFKWEID